MKEEKLKELQAKYGNDIVSQVIRIISPSEIIIDLDKELAMQNKIKVGTEIEIFSILDELKDVDGNSLGKYTNVKSRAKISHIENKYSICQPLDVERLSPIAIIARTTTTSPGYFNVDEEDIKPLSQQTTKTIKPTDLVRTIE